MIQASGDHLKIRTSDLDSVDLTVTDATSVNLNGQTASLSQIQPGSDVRASYQMINGQAKAIHVDVTSKQQ